MRTAWDYRLDIPENIFSALIPLSIRRFGFLSNLSLGKDGGWRKPIVFIICCCLTNYPKTQRLKNSYFYLITIVWVRNSDEDKRTSPSALGSTGWHQLLRDTESNWAGSSRMLQTHAWHLRASWWPRGWLGLPCCVLVPSLGVITLLTWILTSKRLYAKQGKWKPQNSWAPASEMQSFQPHPVRADHMAILN